MRSLVLLLIIFLFNEVFSQNERSIARQGNQQYIDSLYTEAEISYRKSLSKNPSLNEVKFNLSNSLFKQNRFDESLSLLQDVIHETKDTLLAADAHFNRGNSFLQQQKIPEAIDAYKNCLRINPDDEEARYNLSKSLALLNDQDQSDQNQQDQDDQEEQQNSGQTDSEDNDDKNDQNQQGQEDQNQQGQSGDQSESEEKEKDTSQDSQIEGELSKEEIERILQALDREEKKVQDKMKKVQMTNSKKKLEKDW